MGVAQRRTPPAGPRSGSRPTALQRVDARRESAGAPAIGPVPTDPRPAIARAYRFERARRSLRHEHRDEHRRSQRRFWFALAALLLAALILGAITVHQLQQLFGI